MILCLLAVVLIQQCVSAHKGGKNTENKSHKHEICDNPGHGEEDHSDRNEEDQPGHKEEDNHGLVNHEIYDHGVHGIYGYHNHKNIVLEKFRLGLQALHRR